MPIDVATEARNTDCRRNTKSTKIGELRYKPSSHEIVIHPKVKQIRGRKMLIEFHKKE